VTDSSPDWVVLVAAIAPALIAGLAAVVVVVLQNRKTRDKVDALSVENTEQHGTSVEKLGEVIGGLNAVKEHVVRLDSKLDTLAAKVHVIEVNSGDAKTGGKHRLELVVEPIAEET
jgi:hypothetical protein